MFYFISFFQRWGFTNVNRLFAWVNKILKIKKFDYILGREGWSNSDIKSTSLAQNLTMLVIIIGRYLDASIARFWASR